MNKFYYAILFLVVSSVAIFTSCSDDEDQATLTLSQQAVYFTGLNESTYVTYTGSNIVKMSASKVPEGWSVKIDKSKRRILIAGPTNSEDFDESLTSSTITISATSADDKSAADYLVVGTTNSTVDLSSKPANSYIVTEPNTIYSFSAECKGEDQGSISPSRVAILWKTSPAPISYSRLVDGKVEFHVNVDKDDADEDGKVDDLIEGNAVIAAYNSAGDIVWSWHVWATDYSAEESVITINGVSVMDRNLGALDNATTDQTTILNSYGLYYQWGRKDPFVGPYYYNAAGGTDGSMTNEQGKGVYVNYAATTAFKGTEEYAMENPLTFLLGVEDSKYDWLYTEHDAELWGATKSVNDPCPNGWRVASQDLYEGLSIPVLTEEDLDSIVDDYGWDLTDASGESALFMGFGRRGYIAGKIQNVNLNEQRPAPWVGYYWCSEAEGDKSSVMYFAYDQTDLAGNEIGLTSHYRSNGMQVRCQRVE